MKFTKERAVYAAVLGVGLLALVVDRAFLAPSGASAAPPASTPSAKAAPEASKPESAPGAPTAASGGPGLAARLRAEDEAWLGQVRDGFRAAESWIAPPQVDAAAQAVPDEVNLFEQGHKLTVVHGSNSERPRVIVSGKILQLGGELDGWRLAEVTATTAVFRKQDMTAVLKLNVHRLPGTSGQTRGESGEHGTGELDGPSLPEGGTEKP